MIQAAKIIGTGLATTGLIGAGVYMDLYSPAYFSAASLIIAVTTGIKLFFLLATFFGLSLNLTPSMLFALGYVFMFTIGGLSGVFLANAKLGIGFIDTCYILTHFHYVLTMCVVFVLFIGWYFWIPKMLGLGYYRMLGKVDLWAEHSFIFKCLVALLGFFAIFYFFLIYLQAPILCDSFQPIGSMSATQCRVFYRCLFRSLELYSSQPGVGTVTFYDLIIGSGLFYRTGQHNFQTISQSRLEHPGQPEPTIFSVAFTKTGDSIIPSATLKELISLFKES